MAKASSRKVAVGDRCKHFGGGQGTITAVKKGLLKYEIRWDNGKTENYSQKEFSKWCEAITPTESQEPLTVQEAINFFRDLRDLKSEHELCKTSEPADSSRDKEDFPEQLNLLAVSTGRSQSKMTQMRSQSFDQTSTTKSLPTTSETFTQTQVSLMQLLEASPVPEQAEQGTKKDSTTQNQPCLENSSAASAKPDLNSSSLSNLWELPIEDLERGWEDSRWLDIQISIRSSLDAINLERSFRESESLSFPTLLSGRGRGCRDAGLVECETWFKQAGIVPIGYQLSAPAIASLHGFPSNWYREISPRYMSPTGTQDDSQAESLEVKPSPSPKQKLPSNASSEFGQNFKLKTCPKKKECTFEPDIWNGCVGCASCKNYFDDGSKDAAAILSKFPELLPKIKTEEELTPTDNTAIGKHFWCDKLDITVEVLSVQNWRMTPHSKAITTAAKVHAWWGNFPDIFIIPLSDLEEIEEFSCPLPERAVDQKNDSLGKPKTQPERESQQTGSLYQYTSKHTGKDGIRREYPIIEGRERDRANDDDWYWGISYVEKSRGKWCDRSSSIPRKSLSLARAMMSASFLYSATIEAAQYKFCWVDFQDDWIFGEIRPDACPSFFLCSLKEREYFIIPASEWGELRVEPRAAKRRVITQAIATNKPFTYIKELINA